MSWRGLLVAGLLVLAAVAAAHATLGISEVDSGRPVLRPPDLVVQPEVVAPAAPEANLPEQAPRLPWLRDVVAVLLLAAAAVGLALLARALLRRLRHRPGGGTRLRMLTPLTGTGEPRAAGPVPLLAAVDAGLRDLSDDDRDPRRAVIACWLRLEEATAAAGVPRQGSDTAGDLVLRLLRARDVSEPVLAGMADAYRLARYAPARTVDPALRDRSRAALQRLRTELAAAPAGDPA